MNINQYNNNWLQDNSQIIDVSNSIIYSTSNRFQKSFIQNFVDISGSLIVRGGMIYNNHLSNYLSYHDQYIVSLSGALTNYIETNNNSISSNNNKLLYYDLYLTSISSNISSIGSNMALLNNTNNFTGSNNFYGNNVNILGGYYLAFRDSLNLYGTYFGHNGANFEINNYGNSIIVTAPTFDLTNTYTILKGGTNIYNYNSFFPYNGDGKNYITGETNLRLGNVNITDGLLTAYNGLTVYGSLSLPATSINDTALSTNVCLLDSTQTLINKTLTNCVANTQAIADNSTKIATTAYVKAQGYGTVSLTGTQTLTNKTLTLPKISSISNTGTLTLPTTTDTLVGRATTDTLTSKTLNDCTANTQLTTDNSTKIATTAFVKSQNYISSVPETYALLNSPTFTGTPSAPTALSTDNSAQIATTSFVKNAISGANVGDGQISSNVPLKNTYNIFSNTNLFTGLVNFQNGGTYVSQIYANNDSFLFTNSNLGGTIEFFCNTLTTADLVSPLKLSYTGLITDNITMNANKSLTMSSGTGVINQQGGSGSNTLKSSTFSGNTTIQSGSSLILKNSLNTIATSIFQNGATLTFTNPSTPSQYLFQAYDGFGTLYSYTFGSTFTCGASITLNNYDLILSGAGKIDQSSGSGVNLMGAITLNSNSNITLAGTGIISQPGTTSQNIFSTLRFNNSSSNKQITMFQNSTTNLATNYTISIESPSIQRYNAGSAGSHYFSVGSGVSTYTNYAIINSSGLTLVGNMSMSGTGILSQTGTGINLMKNITMNPDNNLLQSGIGVITQSGTGTNALKGTTFSGSNTHYGGSLITQYDSTNNNFTQLSQSGVNYFISNSANGGYITLRTLDASGTANDLNINASDVICNKYFYIYNNKSLVLKDANNLTQSNLSQLNGSLYFDNYSTNGENYITFRTYDTQATPIYNVRMSIRYDAVAIQNSTVLRIFNASNTNYLQAEQYLFNSYLSNFANSNVASNSGTQAIIFRTCNTSGGLTENMIVQYNKITCNQALQVNNGFTLTGSLSLPAGSVADSFLTSNVPLKNSSNTFTNTNQFNNDLVVYTTTNYLKLSDGTASTRFYQTSGDCAISNMKTYSGGFGDIILSTTDTAGSTNERVRISYNKLKTNVNIELPSTYTAPISGQLGYILTPTYIIHSPAVNIVSLNTYYVATLFIPNGVWMVYGQVSFACTGGGSIFSQEYSISSTSGGTAIDKTCLHTTGAMTYASGFYITTKISGIISNPSSSSQIASNLLFRINVTNGTYQMNTTSDTYVQYYAVRIA